MTFTEFVSAMIGPLKRLFDLEGRTTRAEFWPFVFLLYAAQQIAGYIAVNPMMKRIEALEQSGAVPDFHAFLQESLTPILWLSIASGLLSLLLYFAAVTRRLHDSDRSGFHALPALFTQIAGGALVWHCLQEFVAADEWAWPSLIVPAAIASVLNLVAYIYVIVLCVFDGTVGPNRYGPDPKGRTQESEAARKAAWMTPTVANPAARDFTPARIVERDPERY